MLTCITLNARAADAQPGSPTRVSPVAVACDRDEPVLVSGPPGGRTAGVEERGASAEFVGGVYREAWDYNLSDEDLFGGSAAIVYRLTTNWAIGLEGFVIGVHQETTPSTAVPGFATLVRWQRARTAIAPFIEIGVGLSYAVDPVPARGTRFNYVALIGAGVTRPLTDDLSLLIALRWLHLSNNGLAGRDHNPDVQALGARIGVVVPF
jgi:hypothetical protein